MQREDTAKLLEKVDAGCQMAIESFEQIYRFDVPKDLEQLLRKFEQKHRDLQKRAATMLKEYGGDEAKPNPVSTAMSWITTEAKMKLNGDNTQVAKLMMDGCNMGIQTVGENISKYGNASEDSKKLAEELIRVEERFMSEVKEYL